MKKLNITSMIVLFIAIGYFSCEEESMAIDGTFTFGHSYGECLGDACVVNYKISANQLYLAKNPDYGGCDVEAAYRSLPDSSYQHAKVLLPLIPEQLWSQPVGNVGAPDAYDQGGIQISLTRNGETRCWFIDTNRSSVPDYLHDFLDEVQHVIGLLQE